MAAAVAATAAAAVIAPLTAAGAVTAGVPVAVSEAAIAPKRREDVYRLGPVTFSMFRPLVHTQKNIDLLSTMQAKRSPKPK